MVDTIQIPKSDIGIQAEVFRNCFKPVAYRLDKNFSWMTESQREELGRRADKALQQAYVDHVSEMYNSEGSK